MANTTSGTGKTHTVTMIAGDGIGPEVAAATKRIVEASGVRIDWEDAVAGAEAFKAGVGSGVPKDTLASIEKNKVALKGPLETPVGHGGKSANVTLRKLFELYGNIRPCKEMPGIGGPFAGRGIDLIVVRENVEDLYAGIEHMQTPSVAQCLKLISHKGCEKISRLALNLARAEDRKSVHYAHKANIMKASEGMLKRTFEQVAPEYPDIKTEHIIIDNCCHQLVIRPEKFEVIVTTNMNGDIVSDLTSGLVGGLGIAPSANIGDDLTIFEAVHGSAPDIAGQNKANPTALTLAAVMMLRHLGEYAAADAIENALYVTFEKGENLTGDLAKGKPAGTTDSFTETVIGNLGKKSPHWKQKAHKPLEIPRVTKDPVTVVPKSRRVVGIDLFVESGMTSQPLGDYLKVLAEGTGLALKMISNRGTQVYPEGNPRIDLIDHYRCRFMQRDAGGDLDDAKIMELVQKVGAKHRWMHIEKLQEFNGEAAYAKAQGEN
ncbi:MAG: NADP-dependent isocitrate dehydrogenase [Phycisphaerales bacterium]